MKNKNKKIWIQVNLITCPDESHQFIINKSDGVIIDISEMIKEKKLIKELLWKELLAITHQDL